jgi:hypothetical protein
VYPVLNDDIAEVRWEGLLDGQVVMNTFHYQVDTGTVDGQLEMETIAASFEALVWNVIAAAISMSVTNVRIIAQLVHSFRYRKVIYVPMNVNGAVAPPAEVSGASVVVARFGDLALPTNQGRIYIPGIAKADTLDSQVTAAWGAANFGPLITAMEADLVGQAGASWRPVLWTYATPTLSVDVTTANVDSVIRYQRRREIGKGQ